VLTVVVVVVVVVVVLGVAVLAAEPHPEMRIEARDAVAKRAAEERFCFMAAGPQGAYEKCSAHA
jgi:hypothetical protein